MAVNQNETAEMRPSDVSVTLSAACTLDGLRFIEDEAFKELIPITIKWLSIRNEVEYLIGSERETLHRAWQTEMSHNNRINERHRQAHIQHGGDPSTFEPTEEFETWLKELLSGQATDANTRAFGERHGAVLARLIANSLVHIVLDDSESASG